MVLEAAAEDVAVLEVVVVDGTRRFGRGRIGRDVVMSEGPSCAGFGDEG